MDKDYENLVSSRFSDNQTNHNLVSTLLTHDKYPKSNMLNIKLKENLRSYQITGINWLSFMGNLGLSVALCDDMGLGKTIQTLVTIVNESKLRRDIHQQEVINLIICPNTLILNWVNESKKFFYPDEVKLLRIDYVTSPEEIFYCSNKEHITSSKTKKNSTKKEPIIIYLTSYDKMRDSVLYENLNLFYLVLDEAHIVKNPKTKLFKSIRNLSSERRIILTGTPIQNNVMELWALFDFLMPGFLGTENDFEIKYHKKIHTNLKKLNLEEKLQQNIFQTSLYEIRKRVKPFILRRLKQDILKELPEKIIQDYICEMTPIQKELYKYWEKFYENTGKKNKKSEKTQPNNNTEGSGQNNTLKVIDCLRKICNYPGLLEESKHNIKCKKTKEENNLNDFYSSGKLRALEDLLISFGYDKESSKNDTNENKILIFSQFKTMVNIISDFIDFSFPSIIHKKITSDFTNEKRMETVHNFNSDPNISILLLTTNIGGLGLSLTSANIVIMYDHDWNPMRDLQAMDRAHRLGQKKTVEVFRLITSDSIEEKLISLQTFKKYIASNVVDHSQMNETNINVNTFMESLEEFNVKNQNKSKITQKNKGMESDQHIEEELELEYLKKFL